MHLTDTCGALSEVAARPAGTPGGVAAILRIMVAIKHLCWSGAGSNKSRVMGRCFGNAAAAAALFAAWLQAIGRCTPAAEVLGILHLRPSSIDCDALHMGELPNRTQSSSITAGAHLINYGHT